MMVKQQKCMCVCVYVCVEREKDNVCKNTKIIDKCFLLEIVKFKKKVQFWYLLI